MPQRDAISCQHPISKRGGSDREVGGKGVLVIQRAVLARLRCFDSRRHQRFAFKIIGGNPLQPDLICGLATDLNDDTNSIALGNKPGRRCGFENFDLGRRCSFDCHHRKHCTGDTSSKLKLWNREECSKNNGDQGRG